ncbi:MAG: hypothetical protein LC722_04785, partial [Actinobacteria bacterium]|nr:hypothetical protein [Actinomycetota bacterium]
MEPPDGQVTTPDGAASRAPFWLLVGALGALALFFLIRPALGGAAYYHPRPGPRTYDYWPVVLLAFVPYAVMVRATSRGMLVPLPLVLGVVIALYALLIPAPAVQSQDLYQYLVYGRMANLGVSPYSVLPGALPHPWLAYSVWDDTTSVYGPLWTLLSQAAVWAGRSLT